MKFYISGYGGHGKTSVAQMLEKHFGLKSADSSRFACDRAVFPILHRKYGYATPEECYADRRNHREEWFNLIAAYCTPLDRLARDIFCEHDIYCGIRSRDEFEAGKHLADLSIWVEATDRLPIEGIESMQLTAADCDIVIPNNGDLATLESKVIRIGQAII